MIDLKKLPPAPVIAQALIVAVFSLLALHLSVGLGMMEEKLSAFYAHTHNQIGEEQFIRNYERKLVIQEISLYITITILGMVGCALIVMNAAKARTIKESNKLLENRLAAMELTFNGIFIVDKDEKLTYMNENFMDIRNINPRTIDTYIGKDWVDIFPPDIFAAIQESLTEDLHTKKRWRGEFITDEQSQKNIELSLTKLPNGGLVGICWDITEQKQASRDKEELQTQFYQAQKMEAIGRLAGGVAHDFNNILAAINGYAEFLLEDLEDRPSEQKFADKILAATHQARKLVEQILTFSRRNDIKAETVDVIDLITETESMVRVGAIGTVDIQKEINVDHAIIDGNSTQISQVLMNLSVNAIDAMEDKHGTLTIKLEKADNQYVENLDILTDTLPDKNETRLLKSKAREASAQFSHPVPSCAITLIYVLLSETPAQASAAQSWSISSSRSLQPNRSIKEQDSDWQQSTVLSRNIKAPSLSIALWMREHVFISIFLSRKMPITMSLTIYKP